MDTKDYCFTKMLFDQDSDLLRSVFDKNIESLLEVSGDALFAEYERDRVAREELQLQRYMDDVADFECVNDGSEVDISGDV